MMSFQTLVLSGNRVPSESGQGIDGVVDVGLADAWITHEFVVPAGHRLTGIGGLRLTTRPGR
jgi:hypothetical protein